LSSSESEVLFFLGAGASVHAEVPDTLGMVQRFEDHIRQWPKKSRTVETIIKILRERKPPREPVDVELLLETLERLEKKEQEEILWFYELGKFVLEGYSDKRSLTDELKEFIKGKAIVEANKIRYLEPLLEFIEEKTLDIFSVNYDTCIEQFCDTYRKDLQDGFDLYWNPETFGRKTDVRLYKLHGSVTWYRSDKGRYLKIPILSESSKIELVSREKAESLVLYPFRKWTYTEPMLELLVELKRKLDVASYVFVVGYSFRDEHIRRLFWDAANRNRNLVLLLISPHGPETFDSKLRFYDEETPSGNLPIPSSLEGRVVVLPYKFEDILPRLKNKFLFDLRNGQKEERDARAAEIKGQPASWITAVSHFAECEYISKVMQLLAKIDWRGLDWSRKVEISFKMTVNAICHGDRELAHDWMRKFIDATPWFSLERLEAEVMISPQEIRLKVRVSERSHLSADHIATSLDLLTTFVETRAHIAATEELKHRMERILDSLRSLCDYIFGWKGMEYQTYVESRKKNYTTQIEAFERTFTELCKAGTRQYDADLQQRAVTAVEEIERLELQRILERIKNELKVG
jgi:hypothetical protein